MTDEALVFKLASEPSEFEQVHRLNYRSFVEEIPQHPPNEENKLVDKFHKENTYVICLDGPKVVGMVAVRDRRPFSLDEKLDDLDSHLPAEASVCEIRLLAVEPEYRHTCVFAGLFRFACEHCIGLGHTLAVASGTVRQAKLYGRMGFIPFANPVGSSTARYQPMYLTLRSALGLLDRLGAPQPLPAAKANFLPGPVNIRPEVRDALHADPLSHRSERFLGMLEEMRERLRLMTGAQHVEFLLGSGTLANDVVAGQLSLLDAPGVVLSNGEFGERLIDHATRHGLAFETFKTPWGEPHDVKRFERLLARRSGIAWAWAVHCETSTGVLNDLEGFSEVCSQKVKLCMDCISSIGTVPVDLSGVYLASCVSGKGLASFPGISMVLHHHEVATDRRLPRYLDLGFYRDQRGVPFTQSSNLLAALHRSLALRDDETHFQAIRKRYELLRSRLRDARLTIMAPEECASPAVISLVLPPEISSLRLGSELERKGYLLSYRSGYLTERNIVQLCLMGDISDADCREAAEALGEAVTRLRIGETTAVKRAKHSIEERKASKSETLSQSR